MEEKKQEKQERTRRRYAPAGTRSQKMMSFRLDDENTEWLNSQENKGRYLNNLIQKDREREEWRRHQ